MSEKTEGDFFWAKKVDKDGEFRWLSLHQHSLDTMEIAALLYEHWLSEGQKEIIIKGISIKNEDIIKNLVKFLALVHDIGKITPAFQVKKSGSAELDDILLEKLEKGGFVGIKSLCLVSSNKSHHSIASQVILEMKGVKSDISTIVGSHHGKPPESVIEIRDQIEAYKSNYFQFENESNEIHKKWRSEQERFFIFALSKAGFKDVEELPSLEKTVQIILTGLIIVADWIASNENFFPLINVDQNESSIDQDARYKTAWLKWFKTYMWTSEGVDNIELHYKKRYGFDPSNVQIKLAKAIDDANSPGIFILEAPMGVGKTEASLTAVEQLAEKTGRSGMFFGLPTQATSNSMFTRIKDWLEKLSEKDSELKSIRLLHGKAALNDDFSSISKNIDLDGDGGVIINAWFSGKKIGVLDDFVVGTIDHFLLMALKQKHLFLRHLGISKKVIVIDEVHAYDLYMSQYLYRAIWWLGKYKVPVVILSATLPFERRIKMVKEYMKGAGFEKSEMNLSEIHEDKFIYPIITFSDGNSIKQIRDLDEKREDKKIIVERIEDEDVVEVLKENLFGGGIAGIILNTVSRVQQMAEKLSLEFGSENIEIIHSAFLATDRVEKENKIINWIGKNVKRPKLKIIIGTQVLEQSLDIDFDLLITDLSPMDLIIQRIGRLHRHKIIRPKLLEKPRVYILGTSENFDFEKGSSFIYGDFHLIRTQYYLPQNIEIPKDISILVQKVYDDEELIEFEGELLEKYKEARLKNKTSNKSKKKKAENYLLSSERKKIKAEENDNLIGWLNNSSQGMTDESGCAQVRDGVDNIEVILVKKVEHGYAFLDTDEDISNQIDDFEISKKLATQTIKLPNAISAEYNIDKTINEIERVNLIYLKQWQNQSWLKGSLGIILDENNSCILNGWKLTYSDKIGLIYEKVVENEKL